MAMAPQGQAEHDHDHQHDHWSEPNSSHTDIVPNWWEPNSSAGDYGRLRHMAVILLAQLIALAIGQLAIEVAVGAVRYLVGRCRRARPVVAPSTAPGSERSRDRDSNANISDDPEKAAVEAPSPPPPPTAVVYSAASPKLAGAAAPECTICLAEFANGDAVRVMPACRHGFHVRCIEGWAWLAGGRRSTCPTCRAPATVATRAAAAAQHDETAASSSS